MAISLVAGFSPPLNSLAIGFSFIGSPPLHSCCCAQYISLCVLIYIMPNADERRARAERPSPVYAARGLRKDPSEAPPREGAGVGPTEPETSDYNRPDAGLPVAAL